MNIGCVRVAAGDLHVMWVVDDVKDGWVLGVFDMLIGVWTV